MHKQADQTPPPIVREWPDEPRERFLTFKAVTQRVGIGRTAIYQGILDKTFPAPVKYGTRSLWAESEIEAWIDKLKKARAN